MLSPKRAQIVAAAGTFAQEERDLWLPLLAGSRIYNRAPGNFTDLVARLDAVVADTTQAKQLNATMVLLDRIGPVDASTEGVEGIYSTLENREGLLEYALSVLYGVNFLPRTLAPGSTWVRAHPVW